MAIKLVVFDMAGTTIQDKDNVHTALQKAFEIEGIRVSRDDANQVMGYPKPVAIRELLRQKLTDETYKDESYITHIHSNFLKEMISFYETSPDVQEKEGVQETFETLRKNHVKIAIDTGFDRSIANAVLNRVGWQEKGLIDASITSDEVEKGRPYPDMIFRAMKLTGVENVAEVAKVGDTASDLQEGNAAGCTYVIGVTTGAFTREALQSEPHTHLIEKLPELLAILELDKTPAGKRL
ncbi:phosphonatase-like hydrolase [Rhodocytophaga rosea]|uniref:Phosphonatase-like hydrolase n=1 Tax=Rhodocytophaga rosea TaxID=2704465 RepID=A0A6C0GC14_9BACT|nr:phosphonatase-like hydrolase [Rhodocytophaga rosea]QHT65428.1 phosphonatase-like hydrolase [Rhodocytophaga rosea]